jgi:hypothetical protein
MKHHPGAVMPRAKVGSLSREANLSWVLALILKGEVLKVVSKRSVSLGQVTAVILEQQAQ